MTALVLLGCPAGAGAAAAAVMAGGALAVAVTVPATRMKGLRTMVLAVLVCAAAVAGSVAFRVYAVTTGPVSELAERRASAMAEVVVTDDPREVTRKSGPIRRESFVVPARVESVETPAGRVTLRVPVVLFVSGGEWRPLLPSQRIAVSGRFAPADPGELVAGVVLVRGAPRVLSGPSWEQRAAEALRSGLREAAGVLPPAQRGLLPGLVVGDVSRMDDQVKADFKDAGLTHLLAVSGANLAIVAGAAVALGRAAGLPLAARAVLAVAAMVAFAVVARPSPSVLRALLMGGVAAVALGTGRRRDGVAALSVTVLGLILFVPGLARSYAFALSMFATAGILVLAPRWRDRLSARMPRWLAEAIAVAAAAQGTVTPVLVLMSGQLAPVAVPANLLAGPAVAPATLLGFAAALVAPLHMGLAESLVRPAGLATGWIVTVAEYAARFSLGTLPWPGGVTGLVLLVAAFPVALLVLRHRWSRRITLALLAGAVAAATVAVPLVVRWPPPGWLLVACDVGQGDALLVAAGPRRAVVVDTGPDPVLMDRCLRSTGIEEVPLIVLTHPHLDHVGGLAGVFRRRRVGAVVVTPHGADGRENAALNADLTRRRVVAWAARPGTSWRFGPSELTIIAPGPEASPPGAGEGSAANNASVVVYARWAAGAALLSGDIETEAQEELVRRGLPPAAILKVPHHGSGRHDPAFFAAVGARAALISVGADNGYGHPASSTLALLHRLGVRVHRTDLSGDLAVVAHAGSLAVVSRGRRGSK
ncbi:competence protein ComEC [Streptosporangium becharense]|uniref:Competence protein ComEC n=1 Tax=Streptosporangium becharense TaxID=1816182 RepID=A0A7W9IEP4_9ACTN|nr:ComEC/Rec2 family competence protein [Streptosporangium becharense]MBB2912176.1 competence protein ComEC [Streptosporangium becharense]MBB5818723.1 competence protein ComEC [Streptosporangium becharense]